MNPTIRELVKFRHSPLVRDAAETITTYGFGYDSSNDDYKIFTLSYDWRVVETESYPAFVDSFSWGIGMWRRIVDKECVIIALDTSCKKFKQLSWPDTDHTSHKCGRELVALGGCLGMVVVQSSHRMDVWMMMEYGVGEFWTKFIVTTPENVYAWGSIRLLGSDDAILQMGGKNLVVQNLRERTMRDMEIAGIQDKFRRGAIGFSESLVLPIFSSQKWRAKLP
ncbi:F-box/kelch-repeat protein At3g23880-like [Coffea eugenioides]|uniref:F-box/kelch-repeat protein At3g23880-like n=1 Tax=Coffea eugenioides TaxID=49369 RepID=UPI000F614538|nr:F-box/kelch-repeat protein At3g23880-like [Coffea eugenioides]